MKIAYLVFGYKNPRLLEREIAALSSADSAFFIHIDKKSDIAEFSRIKGQNIFFTEERLAVYWAEFSGVRAILLLIRQALQAPENYDYLVLLSGSEYPIRSPRYIHAFLEANRGLEFMNLVKMPNEAAGKPLSRINTLRLQSDRPFLRFMVRAMAKFGLAERDYRKHLEDLAPYAGNTWWTLSREACQYISEFVKGNPQVEKFFRNVFAPEETFFQTIIGNSPFRDRTRRNLVYEDWSARGAHPSMVGAQDVALFEKQGKVEFSDVYGSGELLFARKFSDDSMALLDRVDEMVRRKEASDVQTSGVGSRSTATH